MRRTFQASISTIWPRWPWLARLGLRSRPFCSIWEENKSWRRRQSGNKKESYRLVWHLRTTKTAVFPERRNELRVTRTRGHWHRRLDESGPLSFGADPDRQLDPGLATLCGVGLNR